MNTANVVSSAFLDLKRAMEHVDARWALIGGEALIAYGVPRETLDTDALVDEERLVRVAEELVENFGWTPRKYDEESEDFVDAAEVEVHFMEDPVLLDVGKLRSMIPMRTPMDLPVELLAAQHPIEEDMIEGAVHKTHYGVRIPIAPLGGILLVKTKADRSKDHAAIEQTGEHLTKAVIDAALAWATKRDPDTTDDLRSMLTVARVRRKPTATKAYPRKKRP